MQGLRPTDGPDSEAEYFNLDFTARLMSIINLGKLPGDQEFLDPESRPTREGVEEALRGMALYVREARRHLGDEFRLPADYQWWKDADGIEHLGANIDGAKVGAIKFVCVKSLEGPTPWERCAGVGEGGAVLADRTCIEDHHKVRRGAPSTRPGSCSGTYRFKPRSGGASQRSRCPGHADHSKIIFC